MQSWLIGSTSSLLSSDCQGHVFVQGKSQNSVGGKSSCQVTMLECPLGVWPISTKKSVSRHKWSCQHQSTRECGRFTAFMNSPLLLTGISVVVFLTCCSVMLACGLDKYSMLNPAGVLHPTNFSFRLNSFGVDKKISMAQWEMRVEQQCWRVRGFRETAGNWWFLTEIYFGDCQSHKNRDHIYNHGWMNESNPPPSIP